jgi:hypothetical protein
MRRLACKISFSSDRRQSVMRQVRDPRCVQLEKISRPCATENSNSLRLISRGKRPSCDMNQSGCVSTNSAICRRQLLTEIEGVVRRSFAGGTGRYATID